MADDDVVEGELVGGPVDQTDAIAHAIARRTQRRAPSASELRQQKDESVRMMQAALSYEATPERCRAVARKLWEMAEGGDLAAAKMVLERLLGKPTDAVEEQGGAERIVRRLILRVGQEPPPAEAER